MAGRVMLGVSAARMVALNMVAELGPEERVSLTLRHPYRVPRWRAGRLTALLDHFEEGSGGYAWAKGGTSYGILSEVHHRLHLEGTAPAILDTLRELNRIRWRG